MDRKVFYEKEHLDYNYIVKLDLVNQNVESSIRDRWVEDHLEGTMILDQVVKILTVMEEDTVVWEKENQDRVWMEVQNRMDLKMVSNTPTQRLTEKAVPSKDPT